MVTAIIAVIMTMAAMPMAYGNDGAGEEEYLQPKDIERIMDQLLEYHVDEKKVTAEILKRSLKSYIEQFDPLYIYFLESEISFYQNPDKKFLKKMLAAYKNNEITFYEELHDLVCKAIKRSRAWREEIEKERDDIYQDAKEYNSVMEYDGYTNNSRELKDRVRGRILNFVKYQAQVLKREPIEDEVKKILSLFERRQRDFEDRLLAEDPKERQHVVVVSTLKALAKSLDAHTAFFSPEEAYEMRVRLEKGVQGIGVALQEGLEGITIVRLMEGGPAYRSKKIELNDNIVEIDGISIVEMSFRNILKLIRGQQNTEIKLGLIREESNGNDRFFEVRLKRERIMIDEDRVDISYEAFGDGIIGILKLYAFYENSSGTISSEKDIRDALRELESKGELKGLVLDLRENRGGFLMQAVKVAGLFITNGVVVVSKYADEETTYLRDIDGYTYYDGPMAILTSRASASAAEIVAQTLQDYGAAIVVGDETTYGKGSIQHQTVTDKSGKSAFFKVTVGRYYTASGKSTQIEGVKADIIVPGILSEEELGERFLDYPLSRDSVLPVFIDPLSDVDGEAKEWLWSYYMPTLEEKDSTWREMLPKLRINSAHRLEENENYQLFKKVIEGDKIVRGNDDYGIADLQVAEAVDIVKDMVQLYSEKKLSDSEK